MCGGSQVGQGAWRLLPAIVVTAGAVPVDCRDADRPNFTTFEDSFADRAAHGVAEEGTPLCRRRVEPRSWLPRSS